MGGLDLLRCICDETRYSILGLLELEGELTVGEMAFRLGRDQPLVSHHLRVLRECGMVSCRADGRRSLYRISNTEIFSLVADIVDAGDRINSTCSSACCPEESAQGVVSSRNAPDTSG